MDKKNKKSNNLNKEPEDIFAGLDGEKDSHVQTVDQSVENAPKPYPQEDYNQKSEQPVKRFSKLKIVGVIVIGLLLLLALFFVFNKLGLLSFSDNRNSTEEKNQETQINNKKTDKSKESKEKEDEANSEIKKTESDYETSIVGDDSDKDGLTDSQEIELGTNPKKIDTDNDGLFDYDEVERYKTDPLNSDTDGDGFLDGEEVLSGYNPKGAGKLLNFQKAIEEVK